MHGEAYGYLSHRRNRPTKRQRQRRKIKEAKRKKISEAEQEQKIENPSPAINSLTNLDQQVLEKKISLEEKIKLFRNSFCDTCLVHGVRLSCFKCFEKNNRNYKIPKKS